MRDKLRIITSCCALTFGLDAIESRAQTPPSRATLQDQCAAQADDAFLQLGGDRHKGDVYYGHYSRDFGKCLMRVEFRREFYLSKSLVDAYRLHPYAQYFQSAGAKNSGLGTAHDVCKLIVPSGKTYHCGSSEEYEGFVTYYMEQ